MTKFHFTCVLMCFSAVSALAMPSRSELQKVEGAVKELMAEDMSAMKKGKFPPEKAAETAFGYAREATDDASKFLFYKGAFGLYVKGRKYDEAVKVIETLTREVKSIPDKVIADIIRAKLKCVSKKDGGAVFELYDRIDRRMRSVAEREKLEVALKANPKDANARRQLAFCKVALGDWTGALDDFALVGGKLSEAAKAERGGKVAEAAGLWWTASDDDAEQAELREHAAGLYRQAMDGGMLQGIKLALAKKRIAECGTDAPVAAELVREKAEPVVTQSEPKNVATAPAVHGRYDWTIPATLNNPKTLDFDFGGGVPKLTFYAMPPGSYITSLADAPHLSRKLRGEPINVIITRPFWIAQLPVTVEQFKLFKGAEIDPKTEEAAKKIAGDENLVALARTTLAGVDAYVSWMNERYGKLLPKGWVFRLPTLAENRYVVSTLHKSRLFLDRNRYARPPYLKLKALQAKGLFTEYWSDWSALQSDRMLYVSLITDYREFTRNKCIYMDPAGLVLDAISSSALCRKPRFDREAMSLLGPVLRCGAEERDPFWYCSPETPARCRAMGGDGWCEERRLRVSWVRLAVGFDYVGEWKAKQGR